VNLDWPALQMAIQGWDAHFLREPSDATRRVRQVGYLLQLEDKAAYRFLPMRLLIAWLEGVPFSQQGGRSVHVTNRFDQLADIGLARISEGSPFFAELFERYKAYCQTLGKGPANYIGDSPQTGRVFWAVPI
jgi:hypothetical protein